MYAPTVPSFDPSAPELIDDPYAAYAEWRERDPVHWSERATSWYLFRHADILAMLRDRRFVRRWPVQQGSASEVVPAAGALRSFAELTRHWLLGVDPPEHTRLRALAQRSFSPTGVGALRFGIRALAGELASRLPERFDLVDDFAYPFSLRVIARVLGVGDHALDDLRASSAAINEGIAMGRDPEALARANRGADHQATFFQKLIAERRSRPADDLLTRLVQERDGNNGLDDRELLATCSLIVWAGHDTTANAIANGIVALSRHPEQWRLLRDSPDLLSRAAAEVVRFDSSVQTIPTRRPIEDVELGGRLIAAGQPVTAIIGAANRDPAVFVEPDRFDVRREKAHALFFGAGIHTCLGAALAQIEIEAGLSALLELLPALALETPLEWRRHAVVRGPTHLFLRR